MSFGSTSKLYAQIRNGAPFDVFFAADVERAKLLDDEGIALPESRYTYAIGKIALWSPTIDLVDSNGEVLESGKFQHLALANHALAPYGEAARAVLQARGLWNKLEPKVVMGQNIAQTYQFVESGNVKLGFVAYSQLMRPGRPVKGSYWLVPQSLYSLIEQQAVIVNDSSIVQAFMAYMRSDEALEIIRSFGYEIP